MGEIRTAANTFLRDYVTDGLPSSGENEPVKAEGRALFGVVEDRIDLIQESASGAYILKDTKSDLDGDLAHAAGVYGRVIADSTAENNGYYKKSGGSGSGSWTFVGADPAVAARTAAEGFRDEAEGFAQDAEAAAVSATAAPAENYRFGQALTDLVRKPWQAPLNYFAVWASSLGDCTRDEVTGAITIPAGEVFTSELFTAARIGMTDKTVDHFVYAVVAEGNATELTIWATRGGAHPGNDLSTQAVTRPRAEVVKLTFRNIFSGNAVDNFQFGFENTGAEDIVIYPPEFYAADDANLPQIIRYDETVPVYWPTLDPDEFWLDWHRTDKTQRRLHSSLATKAVDSVSGSGGAAGTLLAPKAALSGIGAAVDGMKVGLFRKSVWRESLPSLDSETERFISYFGVGRPGDALPLISALDPVDDEDFVDNGDGSYSYTFDAQAGVADDGYSQVVVVEVDSTLSDTPFAARTQLFPVGSNPTVAGTVKVTSNGGGSFTVRLIPSDEEAPGTRYSYEVTTRYQPAQLGDRDSNKEVSLSEVHLRGGSFGYGSLTGSRNFCGDLIVFEHATTHAAVIAGGTLTRFAMIAQGAKPEDASITNAANGLVIYTPQGAGASWQVTGGLSYGTPAPFYAHTSGTSYEVGALSRFATVYGRRADGGLRGGAIAVQNVGSVTFDRIYLEGFRQAQGLTDCPTTTTGCVFRRVAVNTIQGDFVGNVVITENNSDPTNVNYRGQAMARFVPGGSARQNIGIATNVEVESLTDYQATLYQVDADRTAGESGTMEGNIWAFDAPLAASATRLDGGGVSLAAFGSTDYVNSNKNVFIVCTPGPIRSGGGPGEFTFEDYVTSTGQDEDSLCIDLRDDPRGLKAIWRDPYNGDFSPAQTPEAARLLAFFEDQGLPLPPMYRRWPTIPTVDEAADLVRSA